MPNFFGLLIVLSVMVIFIINFKPPYFKSVTTFICICGAIINLSNGELHYIALYFLITCVILQFTMVIVTAIQKKKRKELFKYDPEFKNTTDKNLTYEKTELLYFGLSALFFLLIGYSLDFPLAFIIIFTALSAAYYIIVKFRSVKLQDEKI